MREDLTHGTDDAGWVLMMLAAFGTIGHFFWHVAPRIICIAQARCRTFVVRLFFVLNLAGRVRGGLDFWRGNVFAERVTEQDFCRAGLEQCGGAYRYCIAQAAALLRLAVGLATDAECGGGLGCAAVEGSKGGKDSGHGVPRVRRARRLVIAAPSWERYALPTCLRQRMVDALGVLPAQINHAGEV